MKPSIRLFAVPCMAIALLTAATPRTNPLSAAPTVHLQRLWTRSIQPVADSAPAYGSRVPVHGRPTAVVYVLAGNNTSNCSAGDPVRRATLFAFVASSGTPLWTRSTEGPSRCTTAAPVVDPSGRWVYAVGLDGAVHRYNAATGAESRTPHWPQAVTRMPDVEKVSATPTIAHGYLHVATSGFIGDQGHYEGHLVTINLRTGASHVFNSLCSNVKRLLTANPGATTYCSDVQSGLFGRGEAVSDPVNGDVYIVSGNGPWNGRTNWGDSVLRLSRDGSRLVDAFTPSNQATLNSSDADLGSTGPAILPPMRLGGKTYHLLIQGGKGPACDSCSGAVLRLLNRDNLSGHGGPGHLGGDLADAQAPGGNEVLTAPVVWRKGAAALDIVANDSGVAAYRPVLRAHGRFELRRVWLIGSGGTTPVIGHGVLYVARGGSLRALNPANGRVLAQVGGIGDIHWQYPLVAGGRLYLTDESGRLTAYRIQ